jgi:hypothetical protein
MDLTINLISFILFIKYKCISNPIYGLNQVLTNKTKSSKHTTWSSVFIVKFIFTKILRLFLVIYQIGHLTNYGQKAYFWTSWTFSHRGKSRFGTKPVSAGRQESKNRNS